MSGRGSGPVRFDVPIETVFDYLVDPHHRPQWQSSLVRVEQVDGEPRVGQTWIDVTRPGLRPQMRTTELHRPQHWTEVGTWRGVSATLSLDFRAVGELACDVDCRFAIAVLGPLGRLVSALSRPAVRADLSRAARILAG